MLINLRSPFSGGLGPWGLILEKLAGKKKSGHVMICDAHISHKLGSCLTPFVCD